MRRYPDEITDQERALIKELTHNNDHIGAHKLVAEIANHHVAVRVFDALGQLQLAEGEVTNGAYLIQTAWRAYLRKWIENGNGGQAGKEAHRCL